MGFSGLVLGPVSLGGEGPDSSAGGGTGLGPSGGGGPDSPPGGDGGFGPSGGGGPDSPPGDGGAGASGTGPVA
jgi:hypothetical protein